MHYTKVTYTMSAKSFRAACSDQRRKGREDAIKIIEDRIKEYGGHKGNYPEFKGKIKIGALSTIVRMIKKLNNNAPSIISPQTDRPLRKLDG